MARYFNKKSPCEPQKSPSYVVAVTVEGKKETRLAQSWQLLNMGFSLYYSLILKIDVFRIFQKKSLGKYYHFTDI